ncbi:hypothetical protein [Spirosoma jeollabukense]
MHFIRSYVQRLSGNPVQLVPLWRTSRGPQPAPGGPTPADCPVGLHIYWLRSAMGQLTLLYTQLNRLILGASCIG